MLLLRFFIRLPLNPVLRLFSGNRSGISQSNLNTTANTAPKSDNLSEEWDSNPRSQPWQGRILPTELPSHLCDLEITIRFSSRYCISATPPTCAILRTPLTFGLMQHLHNLTFLLLYAPGSCGKITLSLNVSNMSKNHLFLCCLNFLSFLLTSIYNRHHTKLNTLTKLFCDFLLFVLFQIFI